MRHRLTPARLEEGGVVGCGRLARRAVVGAHP
ncbi:hypothetical protein SFR_1061 [Streptomyces sp. FR-008]|nr:hypothetical protein SFR_1061 [Streptomyces sp. FR-008]